MTTGMRRRTRRGKSHDLSYQLATLWRDRPANARTVKINILGENWLREVVALALFLNAVCLFIIGES
jgi:hypothetical protein